MIELVVDMCLSLTSRRLFLPVRSDMLDAWASMIGELREQVQVYGENSGACCLYNHGRYSTSWAFSERILDGGALVGTFFACVSWLDGRFF